MTDRPRNIQEQWVADLLRLLGFDVKLNFWIPGVQPQREIDVLARLGPLQIAFECKNYSRRGVDNEEIHYFYEKLTLLNGTLGVFVANSFSTENIEYCRQYGILPITSRHVLEEIEQLSVKKYHILTSGSIIKLFAAFARILQDWKNYFDESWPFHEKMYATQSLVVNNLIDVNSDIPGLFEYEHTAKGANFFARLRTTAVTIEQIGIGPMSSSREALETIVLHCKDDTGQTCFQGADALIVQGIGLRDASGNITEFGRLLVNVLQGALQALEG